MIIIEKTTEKYSMRRILIGCARLSDYGGLLIDIRLTVPRTGDMHKILFYVRKGAGIEKRKLLEATLPWGKVDKGVKNDILIEAREIIEHMESLT